MVGPVPFRIAGHSLADARALRFHEKVLRVKADVAACARSDSPSATLPFALCSARFFCGAWC